MIVCEECDAAIKDNRWAKTGAVDWFFARSGKAWCPKHIPEWVHTWRKEGRR